jgi:hypothetical protein
MAPCPVFNDDVLFERSAQAITDDASRDVRGTPRWVRHNDFNRWAFDICRERRADSEVCCSQKRQHPHFTLSDSIIFALRI